MARASPVGLSILGQLVDARYRADLDLVAAVERREGTALSGRPLEHAAVQIAADLCAFDVLVQYGSPREGSTGMVEADVVQRALAECWAAEVSGVAYYETLAERFPEHRQDFDVLALVEKTTCDLIEAVARRFEVSIDHGAAERIGVEVARTGNDWREVLENALAYTPHTLRMYENLANVLPEDESIAGEAVVEHERAQIVLFESAVAGRPDDWSAIEAFLERHRAGRPS